MHKNNILGEKFGRWTVIEEAPPQKRHTMWKCKCECGVVKTVSYSNLVDGISKSCGCLRSEKLSDIKSKHNMSSNKLYYVYNSMINRCNNPNTPAYHNYGGRGIDVCEEWKNKFESFKKWANNNGYKEGLTLDRINNDGNYSPKNCRFITREKQNYNRRDNVKPVINGEEYRMKDLSEETGIKINTLYKRYKRGWRNEKLIQPVN